MQFFKPLSMAGSLLLAACSNPDLVREASAPRAGFAGITETTRNARLGMPEWHLTAEDVSANDARVRSLTVGKTLNADTAVQVALINNRDLQAAYGALGLSATDLWEVAIGPVPTIGVSARGLVGGVPRVFETTLVTALLDAATTGPRAEVAQLRFRQAQLEAAGATLALAIETRRAWVEAVAAFEAVGVLARMENATNAASELAAELGRTGAMGAADQAREFAFTAEVAADLAAARLEAQLAKERLARLMGLADGAVAFYVPDALPGLPGRPAGQSHVEELALKNRVDLASGRLELQIIEAEYRLAGQTRMVSDLELVTGVERTQSAGTTDTSAVANIEFQIPVYDTSALASRRGALAYMSAANRLAQAAVNARSEARSAQLAVTTRHSIAKHWRDEVLPLRRKIDEEALKSYSGMITSTFDLLEDAREGFEAELKSNEAKRDYWLAEILVTAAIWGGPAASIE